MNFKFKQAYPKGLQISPRFEENGYFYFGDYTIIAFYASTPGVYDLSFGNGQREARQFLNTSQSALCVYDKDGKWLAIAQSNNFADVFEFNGTAVIIGADNLFTYFDIGQHKFIEKRVRYPFSTGRGHTVLNETTEDVAIISHNFYTEVDGTEASKCYNAFVDVYNQLKLKNKLRKIRPYRNDEFYQFTVNIMINKDMGVEAIERYWHVPVNQYGYKKLFTENPSLIFDKVFVDSY